MDPSYVQITIATCDLAKLREIVFGKQTPNEEIDFTEVKQDGILTTVCEEDMNFGGIKAIEQMYAERIPFILKHEAGCTYSAGIVAFDGKEIAEIKAIHGDIVLFFNEDTEKAERGDLMFARAFVRLRKLAEKRMRKRTDNSGIALNHACRCGK